MIEMLLAQLKRQGPIFGPNSREWCGIVSNAANEISSHAETRHVIVRGIRARSARISII